MHQYIKDFGRQVSEHLEHLPAEEIARAIHIIESTYERDGRIYIFGNGGSLALATHWVSDFNKTVFSHQLKKSTRRFQAIRLPSTESELSAWANDVGFDMVFAGPLQNYLQDNDCVIAISSSGKSPNVTKAVELAKSRHVPVIGLSGFDGGDLNRLADAKVCVPTDIGMYSVVESIHGAILHLITSYFQDYFDHRLQRSREAKQLRALFLDRDGVINKKAPDHEYVTSVQEFVFNPGIFSLMRKFVNEGYSPIVITNQRGIARDKMTKQDLHGIHAFMVAELAKEGLPIYDIFFCPHGQDECSCRKPKPGLLEQAVNKYDIDLESSVLISDSSRDIEMGEKFGIGKNILIPADQPEKYAEHNL